MFLEFLTLGLATFIGITALFLGLKIYSNKSKKEPNKWFATVSFLIFLWVFFAYFGAMSGEKEASLAFYRLNAAVVSLFLFAFYKLTSSFAEFETKIFSGIVFIPSISFFILSIFTNHIISDVIFREWGMEAVYGPLGFWYKMFSFFVVAMISYKLIEYYLKAPEQKRRKIEYFLLGIAIFIIFNVIFNIIVPLVGNTVRYQHFGDFSAIFLLGFTAYAIVRHNLFDIKVLLTSLLVFIITALLILDLVMFTQLFWVRVIKAGIILLFLIFGKYLINSVSKEIQRREELERLSNELVRANTELKEANKKLKELDKAKSEFISIASHQLRTPLTAIKGYLSMIRSGTYGEITSMAKNKIDEVLKSTERLVDLVNNLLNVSKIESGEINISFERVDVSEFLKRTIEEMRVVADRNDLYLNLDLGESFLVSMDKDKIRQAILNIIDNAVKYTEKGGITVRLKKKTDSALIEVSDTGKGMTSEDIESIFESFSRGSAGNLMNTEGAGLGLYIASKFIDMHNGSIWIKSDGKGQGASFFIELPLKQKE